MTRRKLASLKSLADVYAGYKPSERSRQGPYRLLTGRNLSGLELRLFDQDDFVSESTRPSFRRSVLREGDILVSTLFDERKLYIFKQSDPRAVAGDSLAVIRPREDTFLRDYLNTSAGRERFLQEAARKTVGVHISRLRIPDLQGIRVPLLEPNEIQKLAETQLSLVGNELQSLIARGESAKQEFKSTLRRNLHTGQNDVKMEDSVLKTIAAFCNTEGGVLLIGVENKGNILGIEEDGFPNADNFLLHLGNLVRDHLKPPPLGNVKHRILRYSGRSVCVVECAPTDREVWLYPRSGTDRPDLCIRVGPSSKALQGPEITDYCRGHFRT
ncbi:MAG: RNA-binding domain-containing protein [Terriglobia bacterium]|jgi:hypothetical protein